MFAKFLQCDKTPLKEFQYLFIFQKKVGNYWTLVKAVECISLYETILVVKNTVVTIDVKDEITSFL